MGKKITNKINILILFILVSFFVFKSAYAASISINPSKDSVSMEEEFYVDVMMDTEGVMLNGVEGIIKFDNEKFSLVRVEDGKSVISLWVEKPELFGTDSIKFSGIIPNGFDGVIDPFNSNSKSPGLLIRAIFKGLNPGDYNIGSSSFNIMLNDGLGTSVSVPDVNKNITIKDIRVPFVYKEPSDSVPQLDFEIIKDPNIYSNKYVLIFQAKDKGSGIDSVMIKEGRRKWEEISSPYLLKDQGRHSNISILAKNYSGVTIVKNIDPIPVKEISVANMVILIIIVILIFFISKKVYDKRHKK